MENKRLSRRRSVTRRTFLKGMGGGALGAALVPGSVGAESAQRPAGEVPVFSEMRISLTVNGKTHALIVQPGDTLLDVIRDRLRLTGTKRICNHGECGGCTVLLEGRPVYACSLPAYRADGLRVQTVEGLASGDDLHPLQQAFIDEDGYQCGFCTPGFLMTAAAFLKDHPDPEPGQIRAAFSGNLCRCGSYQNIHRAVMEAARRMRGA